jgi:hypothetical protein
MTDRLWEVVKNIILERLTRKPKLIRPSISKPKLLEWVECMDPEVELADLPDYSKARIEDLDDLSKMITKRNLERQRMFGGQSLSQNFNDGAFPYGTQSISNDGKGSHSAS